MIELVPIIAIAAVFGGQWFGSFIRARAHVIIPFNDPISLMLVVLAVVPLFVDVGLNQWWYWIIIAGFFAGYCKGYLSYGADVVYVAVHDLVRQEQEVYPIVRYTAPDGRMCWQPQSFRKVCRSMFLGIHNPLQMMPARNPRHVSVRNVLVRAEAYAYDMAHMESTVTTVTKWRFKFEVESRKYVSAPHNMDSPYDWIANATGYEQLFLEYSKAQTESIERQVNLDVAALKGAKMVMEAMGSKTPNREMMDELGIDLEAALNRNMAKVKREAKRKQKEEEDVGERVPPDHPDSR